MTNILKIILWVIVLVLIAFLVIGRNKNSVDAPTAQDMEFGTAGERDESPATAGSGGMDEFFEVEVGSDLNVDTEIESAI